MEPKYLSRPLPKAIRVLTDHNASRTQVCCTSLKPPMSLKSCRDTKKLFFLCHLLSHQKKEVLSNHVLFHAQRLVKFT